MSKGKGKGKSDHIIEVIMFNTQLMKKGKFNKSFVVPGHQKARKGEVITWELKDTGAVFYFPDQKLFGVKEREVEKGKSLTLTVKDVKPGSYPYAVFTDNEDFAEGGSFPRMIIR